MLDKNERWRDQWAYHQFQTCTRCELWKYRHNVVIGRGSLPSDVVFIGEGPGMSEDMLGNAFIGPSGKLLDSMVLAACVSAQAAGLELFYTNTVLCRPCDGKTLGNRPPKKGEMEACRDNVLRIIRSAKPRFIVYVGDVAERAMRKHFRDLPTAKIFHPAHVLRQGGRSSTRYYHNVRVLHDVFVSLTQREE